MRKLLVFAFFMMVGEVTIQGSMISLKGYFDVLNCSLKGRRFNRNPPSTQVNEESVVTS